MRRTAAAVALAAAVTVTVTTAACGDDDRASPEPADAGTPAEDTAVEDGPADPHRQPAPRPAETGDLDIEVPPGFTPVPLVGVGVGLAVPDGWQAVLLTDEAIARVEELGIVPDFVEDARDAQAGGSVFYASGPGDDGASELELRPVPRPDGSSGPVGEAELIDLAEAAAAEAPDGAEPEPQLDAEPPRVRIRSSAEGATDRTQLLAAGPTSVWSVVLTSHGADDHDRLATAIADTLTFGDGG
jgi:hypothetical protein